jgi:hypothetical protein
MAVLTAARRWLRAKTPTAAPAGSFASWLAATVREEYILCELEPSKTLMGFTAVGGAYPNTYQIAFSRFHQTDVIVGGIYGPVIGVDQNDTALTARASLALVNSNAGSYWWDEANELLYVHTTSGADPDAFTLIQASVRFCLANAPIVLERTPGDPATAVYYLPWMTDDVPRIRRQADDLLSGSMAVPSGSVSFINGHLAWFTLVASDGAWNWKYKPARFLIGGNYDGLSLTRAQYAAMATMRVEDVAPAEDVCRFELMPLQRFAEIGLPVTPFFSADYPNLGDGVEGTKKWIGYGRTIMRPDLTDTATSQGVYTIADAAFQTLFAVHSVWAVRKNTGAWTLLTETTHYTKDLTLCTVTITSASYPHADYTIAVDVTGKPNGTGSYIQTYAAIVEDLLRTFLGAATAELDTTAFAAAAAASVNELSLWIKDERSLTSIMATAEAGFPSLGRSAMGSVQQTVEGAWTARVWDPSVDAITTSLRRADFAAFTPKPKLKTVYSTVRVHYAYDHARDQWAIAEADSPATRYRTKSRDRLDIYTYLRSASAASNLAHRYLLLAGAVTVEASFVERGALLARHEGGAKAFVTYTPSPRASGGYDTYPFEVLDLEVAMAPKLSTSGTVGDLRGLGGRIGRIVAPGSPDYLSATAAERVVSGFITNAAGLADPTDAASGNISLIW